MRICEVLFLIFFTPLWYVYKARSRWCTYSKKNAKFAIFIFLLFSWGNCCEKNAVAHSTSCTNTSSCIPNYY